MSEMFNFAVQSCLATKQPRWAYQEKGNRWFAYWIEFYDEELQSEDQPSYRVSYQGGEIDDPYSCEDEIYFPEEIPNEAKEQLYKRWPLDAVTDYICSVYRLLWLGHTLSESLSALDM